MRPRRFMVIAGEPSGDLLAAELVQALRAEAPGQPVEFFGAGGPKMAGAGVEIVLDLAQHAVVGLAEVLANLSKFAGFLRQLSDVAFARRPDAIVCVDFSGFNRRLAHRIRQRLRSQSDRGARWQPKIIQFVSPQVWASRPGRARKMAEDFDLLLAIFPFEKSWYAQHVPAMRVEFVGHPLCDRYLERGTGNAERGTPDTKPLVVLLPGSRAGELRRHLPVMIEAARRIAETCAVEFRMVLSSESLAAQARPLLAHGPSVTLEVGGVASALAQATLALASTGTVTMECAAFGVPFIAFYKTSWSTYHIAKRLVRVEHLAMPNILAGERVVPEFVQDDATPAHLADAALALLNDPARHAAIRAKLAEVIASLGGPGACVRAAQAIWRALGESPGRSPEP